MKQIPLTQGKVALVDDADYDAVSQFKWYATRRNRRFYAARKIKRSDGKWRHQLIHQFLIPGVPQVDHRDGDGLNNQRHNLRPATPLQKNQGFRRKQLGTTSRFRGVYLHICGKWEARITSNGARNYLGLFESETEAAKAYNAATRKYCGDFASPNFPL